VVAPDGGDPARGCCASRVAGVAKAKVIRQEYVPDYPIDQLEPHPDNPNQCDVGAITESVTANGFYGALLVQRRRKRIVAGEHRWRTLLADGATTVPVFMADLSDKQAIRILLGDNRITRLGHDDELALAGLLQQLAQDGGLSGTGYSGDDVDQLLADLDAQTRTPGDAKLLARTDISIGDPEHQVNRGDVWKVGEHRLCCVEVMTDWQVWAPMLDDDTAIFVPYPGPYLPLSDRADSHRLVMVQPDPYIAGHILDKWAAVRGGEEIDKL
jgi:hypothetical protein